MNTGEITKRLLQDLRIEDVVVKRELPGTLSITVKERIPVAAVACEYGYLNIDREGKVIESYRTLKDMPIPLITGVEVRDIYIGDDVKDETVKTILIYLQQLDGDAINKLSEIAIVDSNYVIAYTTNSVQIRLGKMERLEEKAELTMDFLKDLEKNPYHVEYVDFNYTTPFIKMKKQN